VHQAKWAFGKTLCEEGIRPPPFPPCKKGGWEGFYVAAPIKRHLSREKSNPIEGIYESPFFFIFE
jgi:hypothetical protein